MFLDAKLPTAAGRTGRAASSKKKEKKGKAGAVTKEAKPKPKWNSDLHDMSVYKLSERELKRRQEMYSPKPRPGLLEHVLQRSSSLERIKTSSTFDSSKEFKDVKHSSPEVESRQLHSSPAKSKQDGPPMSMPPFVTSPATTNEQATLSSDEKVKRKSQHLSPSNSLARRATSAPRVASKQHSAPSQQKVQKQSDIKKEKQSDTSKGHGSRISSNRVVKKRKSLSPSSESSSNSVSDSSEDSSYSYSQEENEKDKIRSEKKAYREAKSSQIQPKKERKEEVIKSNRSESRQGHSSLQRKRDKETSEQPSIAEQFPQASADGSTEPKYSEENKLRKKKKKKKLATNSTPSSDMPSQLPFAQIPSTATSQTSPFPSSAFSNPPSFGYPSQQTIRIPPSPFAGQLPPRPSPPVSLGAMPATSPGSSSTTSTPLPTSTFPFSLLPPPSQPSATLTSTPASIPPMFPSQSPQSLGRGVHVPQQFPAAPQLSSTVASSSSLTSSVASTTSSATLSTNNTLHQLVEANIHLIRRITALDETLAKERKERESQNEQLTNTLSLFAREINEMKRENERERKENERLSRELEVIQRNDRANDRLLKDLSSVLRELGEKMRRNEEKSEKENQRKEEEEAKRRQSEEMRAKLEEEQIEKRKKQVEEERAYFEEKLHEFEDMFEKEKERLRKQEFENQKKEMAREKKTAEERLKEINERMEIERKWDEEKETWRRNEEKREKDYKMLMDRWMEIEQFHLSSTLSAQTATPVQRDRPFAYETASTSASSAKRSSLKARPTEYSALPSSSSSEQNLVSSPFASSFVSQSPSSTPVTYQPSDSLQNPSFLSSSQHIDHSPAIRTGYPQETTKQAQSTSVSSPQSQPIPPISVVSSASFTPSSMGLGQYSPSTDASSTSQKQASANPLYASAPVGQNSFYGASSTSPTNPQFSADRIAELMKSLSMPSTSSPQQNQSNSPASLANDRSDDSATQPNLSSTLSSSIISNNNLKQNDSQRGESDFNEVKMDNPLLFSKSRLNSSLGRSPNKYSVSDEKRREEEKEDADENKDEDRDEDNSDEGESEDEELSEEASEEESEESEEEEEEEDDDDDEDEEEEVSEEEDEGERISQLETDRDGEADDDTHNETANNKQNEPNETSAQSMAPLSSTQTEKAKEKEDNRFADDSFSSFTPSFRLQQRFQPTEEESQNQTSSTMTAPSEQNSLPHSVESDPTPRNVTFQFSAIPTIGAKSSNNTEDSQKYSPHSSIAPSESHRLTSSSPSSASTSSPSSVSAYRTQSPKSEMKVEPSSGMKPDSQVNTETETPPHPLDKPASPHYEEYAEPKSTQASAPEGSQPTPSHAFLATEESSLTFSPEETPLPRQPLFSSPLSSTLQSTFSATQTPSPSASDALPLSSSTTFVPPAAASSVATPPPAVSIRNPFSWHASPPSTVQPQLSEKDDLHKSSLPETSPTSSALTSDSISKEPQVEKESTSARRDFQPKRKQRFEDETSMDTENRSELPEDSELEKQADDKKYNEENKNDKEFQSEQSISVDAESGHDDNTHAYPYQQTASLPSASRISSIPFATSVLPTTGYSSFASERVERSQPTDNMPASSNIGSYETSSSLEDEEQRQKDLARKEEIERLLQQLRGSGWMSDQSDDNDDEKDEKDESVSNKEKGMDKQQKAEQEEEDDYDSEEEDDDEEYVGESEEDDGEEESESEVGEGVSGEVEEADDEMDDEDKWIDDIPVDGKSSFQD